MDEHDAPSPPPYQSQVPYGAPLPPPPAPELNLYL